MLEETRRLGHDPAMHLCATIPDLVALDWPPARLGFVSDARSRRL
jgi:hypothetical protein